MKVKLLTDGDYGVGFESVAGEVVEASREFSPKRNPYYMIAASELVRIGVALKYVGNAMDYEYCFHSREVEVV